MTKLMMQRRQFIQRSAVALGLSAVTGRLVRAETAETQHLSLRDIDHPLYDRARLVEVVVPKALVDAGLAAARAAGAQYADVRVTRTVRQELFAFMTKSDPTVRDSELFGIGVRALVDGRWGFAASAIWSPDEAAVLARNAVGLARTNAVLDAEPAEMGQYPAVTGEWATPIRIDPFTVPVEERLHVLASYWAPLDRISRRVSGKAYSGTFTRQERFMGSTEGTFVSQRLYGSMGAAGASTMPYDGRGRTATPLSFPLRPAGWERFIDPQNYDAMQRTVADGLRKPGWETKPTQNGRYDLVLSANATAQLLGQSLVPSMQLDRILGYEANGSGTSFLGTDPLELLGTSVAAKGVTVTANRSNPNGMATVKWDDDGIEPRDFTLVKDGVLVDMQTTREQASWIASWYAKQGRPVRSNGCAASATALSPVIQATPNIVLEPAENGPTYDAMVAGTKRGIAVMGILQLSLDFQGRNGGVLIASSGGDPVFHAVQHGRDPVRLVRPARGDDAVVELLRRT